MTAVPGKLRIEGGVNVCGRGELVWFLHEAHAEYHLRVAEALRRRAPA